MAKKKPSKVAANPSPTVVLPKRYGCHFPFPDRELPNKFVDAVQNLESCLKMPVWLLIQDGDDEWDSLGAMVVGALRATESWFGAGKEDRTSD